jgi:hypothetical protein
MSNTNTLKINKSNINQDKLRSFAAELAKDVKTQADLAACGKTYDSITMNTNQISGCSCCCTCNEVFH